MIEHLLNRQMDVWRADPTTDAGGGQEAPRTQVGTVWVRLSRPTSTEHEISQQERGWVDYDVYMAPGADVRRADQLRDSELTLKVLATMRPSEAIYTKAECEQQQPSS